MWSYENDIEDDVRFCCKTFIDQRIDRAEKDYEAFQTTRLVRRLPSSPRGEG